MRESSVVEPCLHMPIHHLRQAVISSSGSGLLRNSSKTSVQVMSRIIDRACRDATILFPFVITSSGSTGSCLINVENVASGRRTSAVLRTPDVEIIGNVRESEQEKKAASSRVDTSDDGVEEWKTKNFSA